MNRIITILFYFTIAIANAQYEIEWINPATGGDAINDISFVDPSTGWASAKDEYDYSYSLYEHRDGEWHAHTETYYCIRDLCTTSDGAAWVLDPGNYDTCLIYRISSTGCQKYLFPDVHFRAICFTDPSHGWAAGYAKTDVYKGIIYNFENGQWSLEQTFDQRIYKISLSDPVHGWAYGKRLSDYKLYRYDGQEWTQTPDIPHYILDIDCLDENHAYAVTHGGELLYYNGMEWIINPIVSDPWLLNSVSFPEPGIGWIGGEYGGIFEAKYAGFVEVEEPLYSDNDLDIDVFPNPAKDIINIRITGCKDCKLSFDIIDLAGINVMSVPTLHCKNNDPKNINIRSLEPGIYILKIKYNERVNSKKILVL